MFCTFVSNIGKYSLWNECYEPRENITKTNECDLIYVLLSATSECLNIYYYIMNVFWWENFNLYSKMWYVVPVGTHTNKNFHEQSCLVFIYNICLFKFKDFKYVKF